MSLQFVYGSPGSGKSTFIYNKIIKESISNPRKNYIIIVPEQFTMLTQKELVRLHPDHVIMNIDVLSFNRLAYRVFDELGIESLDVLEETGKSLVIRKLAMDKADELSVLSANINKTGYVSEIKSFISELAQYNIGSNEFNDVIESGDFNSHFTKKAKDIGVIYKAYEEFIQDKYITAESILVRLNEVILDSHFVSDSVFVFDGFTGFTPLQNLLLTTILPIINKAYVVVTMDVTEPLYGEIKEYEVFAMSKRMIAATKRICEKCGTDIEENPIICNQQYRYKDGGVIDFIEKNLFRTATDKSIKRDTSLEELSIHLLANPRQEIEYVASQIAKDIRENNIKYKDIAICAANIKGYKDYFQSIFNKYNIPFYIDAGNEIVFNPVIEFIKSAFLIIDTNFAYETVIQLLRCNLSDISMDEVDMLDNYLNAAKIRGGKAYNQDFTYEPRGFEGRLDMINDIRRRFVEPLIDFNNSLVGDITAEDISSSLYQLLCAYKIEHKLDVRAQELESIGDNVKSSEYSRIYKIIISILDKIVTLLGKENIELRDYSKIFLSACEGAKISTIPISSDCVVIGDLERTRYDKPKVMYLMGVNDGVIPSLSHSTGIISQTERLALKAALEKSDADLAPTDREKSFMQRFYVYMILTKASDRICITYSANDNDANVLNRSYLIDELLEMFPDMQVDVVESIKANDYLVTIDSTKRYISHSLRQFVHGDLDVEECDSYASILEEYDKKEALSIEDIDEMSALFTLMSYANDMDYACYNNIYSGAFYYHGKEQIDRTLYDGLVNASSPRGSVSRLESYRKCAYSYFLNYCLGIKERETARLRNLDYGSIYHDILEEFSNSLNESDIRWKDVDEETRNRVLDKACDKVYGEYNKIELLDTPMEKYTLYKIKSTMNKTVENLIEQSQHTGFEPYGFEVELSEITTPDMLKMTLRDGRKMSLTGRIDRVDTYEKDGIVYVKIVDYKSGNTKIEYDKIYNGLQLQLIYYLDAAVKGMSEDKTVKPGAIFYYHIKDPIVEYSEVPIEDLVKSDMIPNGIFFDEIDEKKFEKYLHSSKYDEDKKYAIPGVLKVDIAKALDTSCEKKSLYAPVNYTKDKDLSGSGTKAISVSDIERIEKHVENKMVEIGSDMYEGIIDAKPVKDEGCKFCPYKGICGFDIKQPGFKYSDYTIFKDRKKMDELFRLIGE
ncbi:MAG: exodeoxyribonuclease V subunit gamma [Lachnospiraceae bacterium]|nr:exodeoxyribonuclease V subunit gamma [Lachnospiraceae bacterium]